MESNSRTNLQNLLLAGLMAALTAVCSWINISLFFTPVPINLALIGPYMAGLLLGLSARRKGTKYRVLLMVCGLAACYACGLIWFMVVTGSSLWAGLVSCVFPFLPGDAVKITVAALLTKYLAKALKI